MKKTILALCMLSFVFVSCDKDDKDEPVTPTKENLTGSYKMTAATMNSVDIFNNDMFTEACERDDVYKLNADLSYNIQDAGTVCVPPTTYTGTWSLVSATQINIDGDVYTIKSWNGKTLVGEATDNSTGTPLTFSVTYVKQ